MGLKSLLRLQLRRLLCSLKHTGSIIDVIAAPQGKFYGGARYFGSACFSIQLFNTKFMFSCEGVPGNNGNNQQRTYPLPIYFVIDEKDLS